MNRTQASTWTGATLRHAAAALIASVAALLVGQRAWAGDLGWGALAWLAIATGGYAAARGGLAKGPRNIGDNLAKLALTIFGVIALLRHPIAIEGAATMPVYRAIAEHVREVDPSTLLLFSLLAMLIKLLGVIASAFSWHLLLMGQRIRFPFWSMTLTSFLIGRFIGTFLPSTLGLDGYTLYEASRYSNQWARALAAKAVEKVIGIAGLFSGMVLTLPFGYQVLQDVASSLQRPQAAPILATAILVIAGGVTATVLVGVLRPSLWNWVLETTSRWMPTPLRNRLANVVQALDSYHGQSGLLLGALAAKFVTHFTTAVVYYFTALAIGVVGARFWPIVFGSTIQILATLLSPTIAGEGAREAFQALLLSNQLGGVAQAVLSAAIGFLAAEAATLWGGAFLWLRTPSWRPGFAVVDECQVDFAWLEPNRADSPVGKA